MATGTELSEAVGQSIGIGTVRLAVGVLTAAPV